MAVDLHTHSEESDGTDSPAELIRLADEAGLSAIALTDHDTLSGIEQARAAAGSAGPRVVAGVELSVEHDGVKIHLLVYFLEPGTGPLQDRLAELREGRHRRNVEILARLRDLGYDIEQGDVAAQAAGEAVGRPHIADALVAKGVIASRAEAFDGLLSDGGMAYVPRPRLSAAKAIHLATASGAVTSVAHPYTIDMNASTYPTLFEELGDAGLTGLEAFYPEHTPDLREHLAALATDLGLVATGGSDYHGAGKPGLRVGTGRGDLVVPDTALSDLEQRRV
ncbi:MAG: PHP domain-containing protein [Acidimicrobiia bacterium]|nr:MAG: PHP domain-containing protein [Acidimicrobiia bacterium]